MPEQPGGKGNGVVLLVVQVRLNPSSPPVGHWVRVPGDSFERVLEQVCILEDLLQWNVWLLQPFFSCPPPRQQQADRQVKDWKCSVGTV